MDYSEVYAKMVEQIKEQQEELERLKNLLGEGVKLKFVEGGSCDECCFIGVPIYTCDYVFPCEAHDRKDNKTGHWELLED
jgi:hypothetical protein